MGYPINANLTRRIAKESFYAEIDAAQNERAVHSTGYRSP